MAAPPKKNLPTEEETFFLSPLTPPHSRKDISTFWRMESEIAASTEPSNDNEDVEGAGEVSEGEEKKLGPTEGRIGSEKELGHEGFRVRWRGGERHTWIPGAARAAGAATPVLLHGCPWFWDGEKTR